MKGFVSKIMLIGGLLVAALPCAAMEPQQPQQPQADAATPLPDGTMRAGTWASEQLRKDTLLGALAKASTTGCAEPKSFTPYIIEEPAGGKNARRWSELWVFDCSVGTVPVKVQFQETSDGGADYSIR